MIIFTSHSHVIFLTFSFSYLLAVLLSLAIGEDILPLGHEFVFVLFCAFRFIFVIMCCNLLNFSQEKWDYSLKEGLRAQYLKTAEYRKDLHLASMLSRRATVYCKSKLSSSYFWFSDRVSWHPPRRLSDCKSTLNRSNGSLDSDTACNFVSGTSNCRSNVGQI